MSDEIIFRDAFGFAILNGQRYITNMTPLGAHENLIFDNANAIAHVQQFFADQNDDFNIAILALVGNKQVRLYDVLVLAIDAYETNSLRQFYELISTVASSGLTFTGTQLVGAYLSNKKTNIPDFGVFSYGEQPKADAQQETSELDFNALQNFV